MTAAETLGAYVRRLGWGAEMIALAAQAAFPNYTPGDLLDEERGRTLCSAIETLAQAGRDTENLPVLIDHYRKHHGEQWRARFWEQTCRTAALRHNNPQLFGLSPLEADPQRLAQHPQSAPAPAAVAA